MCLIRSELGFLGELDDAFLVPLAGIPFAHGPSIPPPLPRGVLVFVIRAFVRRAFPPFQGNRCQNLRPRLRRTSCEFSYLRSQGRYACDVEGVTADFLLVMAGLVKTGVCSKARFVLGIGMC